MLNSCRNIFASAPLVADMNALIYSAKSFTAAMLAYYFALSLGLNNPSWSIITVYIVSQSSAGASLSRCVYRLAGTLAGAAMTVAIVPNFVNDPVICSLVLTGWITGCLYLSQLDRTPRAYAFVLAGYTASLIGFPAVFEPGTIFDTAIIRVQEITIGVVCASLIHRYIMPERLSGLFNSKLDATLKLARHMVTSLLTDAPLERGEYLKLAEALQALEGVGHHLPYDASLIKSSRRARWLIHDRLARLLVVCSQLHDSLREAETFAGQNTWLVEGITQWLSGEHTSGGQTPQCLFERYFALSPSSTRPLSMKDVMQAKSIKELQEAVRLLQQCDLLAETLRSGKPLPPLDEGKTPQGYVYHKDHLAAARAALGAFVIIFTGCLIWIYSAWSDGAVAVSILGVCCTLFGNFDTPAPHIVKYIVGSVYGMAISLGYSFVILPQVTEFTVLVAVLAPIYLLAGSLQVRPATTFMAMGITLTLPILSELGAHYSGHFSVAINTAIALFAATGFAVIGMTFLQTVEAGRAINRLLYRCRRDIRHRAMGLPWHDVRWTNVMIDRTALLLPRLHRSHHSREQVLNRVINYLRIGLAISQLQRSQKKLPREMALPIKALLSRFTGNTEPDVLLPHIEALLFAQMCITNSHTAALIASLIDLRTVLNITDRKADI